MKYIRLCAVILVFCLAFTGCTSFVERLTGNEEKTFDIPDYNLQITANSNFEASDKGAWDLQITNNSAYISVMAYKYIDLAEGQTAKDIYDFHNDDLLGRRENVSVIEEEATDKLENKTVVKTLYSAEYEGNKNYYASYLVDFEEEETFAWVLITATPSYLENNAEALDSIVYTLTTVAQNSTVNS